MALKSLLYRKDTGVVITHMPTDHAWSDIELGNSPSPTGFYFSVVELEVSDEQLSPDDPKTPTPCILFQTLKVDDVNNPTSLVEV